MRQYPLRLKFGVIATLLLFVAAILVVGLVAWRQDSLVWRVGEDTVWHAYKLDRDAIELRSYLALSEPGPEVLNEVRLRFELLYSRLTLLRGGEVTELIRGIPGTDRLVDEIEAHLQALDARLRGLEALDDASREALIQRLGELGHPAERLIITINGHLAQAETQERERLQWLYGLLLALIMGMSVAAMLVVAFLVREARDNAAARRALEGLSVELETTARRAESASQAKSEFLATVSHEIRTPLNGVIGMSDLLVEQPLPDQARHYADTIHESARRLMELINDILDFSKIEAGRLELETRALSLSDLVNGAVSLFRPQAGARGLWLEVDLDPSLPARIVSDPGRLRQVLLNLLSNAVKFTEEGGVRIEVAREGEQTLRVAVVDTGCGVSLDKQPRLFEPFQQGDPGTARRFGGSGLGLAISKRLVEALGGEIGVDSRPGEGCRSWFRLPLVEATTAIDDDDEEAPSHHDAPALGDARLLVVEDNPVNQQVALAMLTRLGCRASLACSGAEALESVARERFDLIFMDVQMPDLDGLEVTRRIRARGGWLAEVPIVAMTAGGPMGDQARCLAAGMTGYLAKPLLQASLLKVLHRHLSAPPGVPAAPATRPAWATGEAQLVDADIMRGLHDSLGGAGLAALVAQYRRDARACLEALAEALANDEAPSAQRLAHQLKGESATLGAVKVAGLATRLERAARDGRLEGGEETLARLRERLAETLEVLAREAEPS